MIYNNSNDDFENFFDNLFNNNDSEFSIVDNELIYSALTEIFNKEGLNKQLANISLACLEFLASKSTYDYEKDIIDDYNKSIILNNVIKNLAEIMVLIETIVVSNDNIYSVVENIREDYINNELGDSAFSNDIDVSNRRDILPPL